MKASGRIGLSSLFYCSDDMIPSFQQVISANELCVCMCSNIVLLLSYIKLAWMDFSAGESRRELKGGYDVPCHCILAEGSKI